MEDYVMTMIKRTSIFMVLAQILLHFRPSPDYEKYFRFLTGMMTALMLFLPMSEAFQKGSMEAYQEQMAYYIQELEQMSLSKLPQVETPEMNYLSTQEEEIKCRLNKCELIEGYVIREVRLDGIEKGRIQISAGLPEDLEAEICIPKVQLSENDGRNSTKEKSERADKLQKQIAQLLEVGEECVEVELIE